MNIIIVAIAVAFCLFAWSRAIMRFKDHKINTAGFLLWSIFWIGIILFIVKPESTTFIARLIGVSRPVDGFVYGSVVVLLYLVFRLYVQQESLNHEITRIVRAMAINMSLKEELRRSHRATPKRRRPWRP